MASLLRRTIGDHGTATEAAAYGAPVPRAFNLAEACCDRWADGGGRLALVHRRADGRAEQVSFDALRAASTRVALVLRAWGIGRRDRIAILLPQGPEAAIAHLAAYRLGAIAVPLARMLDTGALHFRLRHAGCAALLADEAGLAAIDPAHAGLPALRVVLCTEGRRAGALSLWEEAGRAVGELAPAATAAGDPAVLLYTAAGPAGRARGVLHAHRALLGNLPAVAAQHGGLGRAGDVVWTPTDWAWRSALFDALLPALAQGIPIVAQGMARFDPEAAFDVLARHGVRNAVLPASALRAMRAARPPGAAPRLRSIGSSGDAPDGTMAAWAQAALGATLRHAHGRAECNLILAGCEGPLPAGRAVPGHEVAVLGSDGRLLPPWETGLLAVRRPHPGLFLGYWKDAAATARMLAGPWMPTGDLAALGEDGAVLLPACDEAAAATSGEGMGPADVEHCLLRHPAVAMAAVVGPADALAEEHATAVIVPRGDAATGPELAEELRGFMRARMFGHRYPRRVAFAQSLPRGIGGQLAEKALGTAVGLGARRPGTG